MTTNRPSCDNTVPSPSSDSLSLTQRCPGVNTVMPHSCPCVKGAYGTRYRSAHKPLMAWFISAPIGVGLIAEISFCDVLRIACSKKPPLTADNISTILGMYDTHR